MLALLQSRLVRFLSMEETPRSSFNAALRYFLDKKGHGGQSWLAQKNDISQQAIGQLYHDKMIGKEETRRIIAKALGYGYEQFLGLGQHILAGKDPGVDPESPQESITIVQVGSKEDRALLEQHSPDYRGGAPV